MRSFFRRNRLRQRLKADDGPPEGDAPLVTCIRR